MNYILLRPALTLPVERYARLNAQRSLTQPNPSCRKFWPITAHDKDR